MENYLYMYLFEMMIEIQYISLRFVKKVYLSFMSFLSFYR